MTDGGDVSVRLRLPTPQCAPNFAFLMAADARAAVWARAPACGRSTSMLEDHYTGAEINAAVNARRRRSRTRSRARRAGELDALRALFQRKALLARQSRLLDASTGGARSATARARRGALRELRRALGIDASDDARAVRHRRRHARLARTTCGSGAWRR